MQLPLPFEVLTLEGEQDCCLRLPLEPASTEGDWALGAPGLPREAEDGLSGNDVLKFGGASSEKPGISEGFQGRDFTVGEAPRDGAEFFTVVELDFDTEEEQPGAADTLDAPDGADRWRVGVADLTVCLEVGVVDLTVALEVGVADLVVDLEVGVADLTVDLEVGVADLGASLGAVTVGLAVGVDERAVDLVGVEDLTAGAVGLDDGKVARDVGVDGLEDLAVEFKLGRPVGVAALVLDVRPPEDDGLLSPVPEEFTLEGKFGFLERTLPLEAGSSWTFASCKSMEAWIYKLLHKW